jgi:hypothetical protein
MVRPSGRSAMVTILAVACVLSRGPVTVQALMTSASAEGGNTFTTGYWCAGSAVLSTANGSTVQDTYVDQDKKNVDTNYGTANPLYVQASSGGSNKATRMLLQFSPLPSIPAGCAFKTATLTVYQSTTTSGLTYSVYNLAAAWVATSVTWNNQPGTTGSAVAVASSAGGSTAWTVTTLVAAQYAGANHGFIVEDLAAATESNSYASNESTTLSQRPTLTITWG